MSDAAVTELEDLIEGRHESGLHDLADDRSAADVAGFFGAADWRVMALSLDTASDKNSVLAGFAAAGRFPGWFGGNWDALEDSLRDLSWAPAAGYVVLIDGWDLFADSQRADAMVLHQILGSVAEWWAEAGTPFHVLLRN